jgi:hypothetical protein
MQIERVYQPDMRCQMRAILLLLRIRPPYEGSRSRKKEVAGAVVQHFPPLVARKAEYEQSPS